MTEHSLDGTPVKSFFVYFITVIIFKNQILDFFEEYLIRTEARHSASYHDRNRRVIKQFKKFLREKRPYLTRLSQLRPELIEEYQRYRLTQIVENAIQFQAGLDTNIFIF